MTTILWCIIRPATYRRWKWVILIIVLLPLFVLFAYPIPLPLCYSLPCRWRRCCTAHACIMLYLDFCSYFRDAKKEIRANSASHMLLLYLLLQQYYFCCIHLCYCSTCYHHSYCSYCTSLQAISFSLIFSIRSAVIVIVVVVVDDDDDE